MENTELMFQDNWEKLETPEIVQSDKKALTEKYGKFTLEPLYKGFGITIGHSLRRVLLSSLQGCAVFAVKIEGISHEFESIKGIQEDVLQIILNLKQLDLKQLTSGVVNLEIVEAGPKVIKASDISTFGNVEIMNPDHVICHLDEDAQIEMSFYVKMNRGFIPAEENYDEDLPIGTIFLDSNHSPIKKARYDIQNTRVGQKTDYEKLIFEVWTDGRIKPEDSMGYAAKILKHHYNTLINFDETIIPKEEIVEEEEPVINPYFDKNINELELSVRSINCLQSANIDTIGQLVEKTENEMLKTKNFGRKSLQEIKSILAKMGLSLGMKVETETTDTDE